MVYQLQGTVVKRTYSQIDMDARRKIVRWRMANIGVEVIAVKLGRYRSIFRELRRNTFEDQQMRDLNGYYGVTANSTACERCAKLRKLARSRTCVSRFDDQPKRSRMEAGGVQPPMVEIFPSSLSRA